MPIRLPYLRLPSLSLLRLFLVLLLRCLRPHLLSIAFPPFEEDGERQANELDADDGEHNAEVIANLRNKVGAEGDDLERLKCDL